jgi:hypothetical protein
MLIIDILYSLPRTHIELIYKSSPACGCTPTLSSLYNPLIHVLDICLNRLLYKYHLDVIWLYYI